MPLYGVPTRVRRADPGMADVVDETHQAELPAVADVPRCSVPSYRP